MAEAGFTGPLLEAALKPFQVLEALSLPAQYERSFKIEPGLLITQRFMLGVRTEWAAGERLIEAARLLGMPASVRPAFAQALSDASTVLFGFEGSEPDEGAGVSHTSAIFKVYTEHRSRLANRSANDPPVELFRGFKWQADRPDHCAQTVYWCRPGFATEAIHTQVGEHLAAPALAPVRELVATVIERAGRARPGFTPQWIELGEVGQPVRAFDLNLYDAGLRVAALAVPLTGLADSYRVNGAMLSRLLSVAGSGLLGHVSAGMSRRGDGFLTVYFEPAEQVPSGVRG